MFRYCSSSRNLGVPEYYQGKKAPPEFVNLRMAGFKSGTCASLGAKNLEIPHSVDVRNPSHNVGWYGPKNVLLLAPSYKIIKVEDAEAHPEGDFRYSFAPITSVTHKKTAKSKEQSVNEYAAQRRSLYDSATQSKINLDQFERDPLQYFGPNKSINIKINGIPAAFDRHQITSPPAFQKKDEKLQEELVTIAGSDPQTMPTGKSRRDSDEASPYATLLGLDSRDGIRMVELHKFLGSNGFIMKLCCLVEGKSKPVVLGQVDLYDREKKISWGKPIIDFESLKSLDPGKLVISIELAPNSSFAVFPESIIAIKDAREPFIERNHETEDSLESRYSNALYVYLPSMSLSKFHNKTNVFLFVSKDGTTYFGKDSSGGIAISGIARSALTQVFPPRLLSYSLEPLDSYSELSRTFGIKMARSGRWRSGFVIEVIAISNRIKTEQSAWKTGELEVSPDNSPVYRASPEVWLNWKITTRNLNSQPVHLIATCIKTNRVNVLKEFNSSYDSVLFSFDKDGHVIEDEKHKEDQIRKFIKESVLSQVSNSLISEVLNLVVEMKMHSGPPNVGKGTVINTIIEEFDVIMELNGQDLQKSEAAKNEILDLIQEEPLFDNESADLMLRIKRRFSDSTKKQGKKENDNAKGNDDQEPVLPLCEIVLTNISSKSILIYLPQLTFSNNQKERNLFLASDGSTFYRYDPLYEYARKSAGQVIPIEGKFPLQQRTLVGKRLVQKSSRTSDKGEVDEARKSVLILPGQLAIDPSAGMFAFSEDDCKISSLTVDYNYAIASEIGAGTYDRSTFLKKNPTKWVSKSGHAKDRNAMPSSTFQSISDAFSCIVDGDVIQIEDSAIYEEMLNLKIGRSIRNLTLQSANQAMPIVKATTDSSLSDSGFIISAEGQSPTVMINGLYLMDTTLFLLGGFERVEVSNCTIDTATYKDGRPSIRISNSLERRNGGRKARDRKTQLNVLQSVIGAIETDNIEMTMTIAETIVENLAGSPITVGGDDNSHPSNHLAPSNIVFESEKSSIIGMGGSEIRVRKACCSDCIITSKLSIGDVDNSCLRYSRIERGSTTYSKTKDRDIQFRCTAQKPIFVSTVFGSASYLLPHDIISESILESGENGMEMGAYNSACRSIKFRTLQKKLEEFLPVGIRSGIVYVYD